MTRVSEDLCSGAIQWRMGAKALIWILCGVILCVGHPFEKPRFSVENITVRLANCLFITKHMLVGDISEEEDVVSVGIMTYFLGHIQRIDISLCTTLQRTIRQVEIHQFSIVNTVRASNREFRNECRGFSHVGDFKLILELMTIRKVIFGEFSSLVIDGYEASAVNHEGGGYKFGYQPSTLAIHNSLSIEQGGLGSPSSGTYRTAENAGLTPHTQGLSGDVLSLFLHLHGLMVNGFQGENSYKYAAYSYDDQVIRWQVCRTNHTTEITFRIGGGLICLLWGGLFAWESIYNKRRRRREIFGALGGILFITGSAAFLLPPYYRCEQHDQHGKETADPPFSSCQYCTTRIYLDKP